MRSLSWIHVFSVTALICIGVGAQAQDTGLRVDDTTPPPRIQGRIGLGSQAHNWSGQAGVVLGDYYFGSIRLGSSDVSGGFRATSGLLLGQRASVLGAPGSVLRTVNETWSAMPYVGIGWTSVAARKGWGLTADLGLAARTSTGGLRVGNAQTLDDLLREVRLDPIVQLGVSYSF